MNATTEIAPLSDDRNDQVLTLVGDKTPCNCSDNCPQLTGRFFAQGHDARLVTRLRNAVVAGEISTAEAFAEITKRGGTERLQIKLDAAVANARKPRKAKKAAKAAPLVTFEMDDFVLREDAHATETGVWARVGRWSYQGEVTWHRIVEEGATDADTVAVFRYEARDGESRKTLRFTQVAPPAAEVAEAPAADEPEALPVLVSLRGDAAAEAAREEVAEPVVIPERAFAIATPENTDDIPF